MSKYVEINLRELEIIKDGLNDVKESFNDANNELNLIDQELAELKGKSVDVLKDLMVDAFDSKRGIENNLEELKKQLGDYYEERKETIKLIDDDKNIKIAANIKKANQQILKCEAEIELVKLIHIPDIHIGLDIFDQEKKYLVNETNNLLLELEVAERNYYPQIESFLNEAKEEAIKMEEWYENDYNELLHYAYAASEIAAVSGLSLISPVLMAGVVGAYAGYKFYEDGYSIGESVGYGTITGGLALVGEIVGPKVLREVVGPKVRMGAGKVLGKSVETLSKHADDIVKKIELPNEVIQQRLKSVSNKTYAYNFAYTLSQKTETKVVIPGESFDMIMDSFVSETSKTRMYQAKVITPDFNASYEKLLVNSAQKISKTGQASLKIIENELEKLMSPKRFPDKLNLFEFTKTKSIKNTFILPLINGTMDIQINDWLKYQVKNENGKLHALDLEMENTFKGEVLEKITETILSTFESAIQVG